MNKEKLESATEVLVGLVVLAVLCILLWLLGLGALSVFQLNAAKGEPLVVLFSGGMAFAILFGSGFLLLKVASAVGFVTLEISREFLGSRRSKNRSDSEAR